MAPKESIQHKRQKEKAKRQREEQEAQDILKSGRFVITQEREDLVAELARRTMGRKGPKFAAVEWLTSRIHTPVYKGPTRNSTEPLPQKRCVFHVHHHIQGTSGCRQDTSQHPTQAVSRKGRTTTTMAQALSLDPFAEIT